MNKDAVEDWLRVRRQLLKMESDFTDMAITVASGIGSQEQLQQARVMLEAMRELCTAAYQRAFPATEL
jgi:hypothetical protein